MRQMLAQIDLLGERIARAELVPPRLMDWLERELLALADLLETHLAQQECELFPKINKLTARVRHTSPAEVCGDDLLPSMEQASLRHQDVLAQIERIQTCLCDPEWADKGPLVERLIDKVRELEVELTAYGSAATELVFWPVRDLLEDAATPRTWPPCT
jgi:hypothetical protein